MQKTAELKQVEAKTAFYFNRSTRWIPNGLRR